MLDVKFWISRYLRYIFLWIEFSLCTLVLSSLGLKDLVMMWCRPEDLRVPFEKYGPVKDVYLPKNYYTGYACLCYVQLFFFSVHVDIDLSNFWLVIFVLVYNLFTMSMQRLVEVYPVRFENWKFCILFSHTHASLLYISMWKLWEHLYAPSFLFTVNETFESWFLLDKYNLKEVFLLHWFSRFKLFTQWIYLDSY